MNKFSNFAVTAFALAMLATTLSGCQKQEDTTDLAGNSPANARSSAQTNTSIHAQCANCGVIDSVREVTTKGEGSGLGVVGGAIVGGLLGNQVGAGSGKDVATVAGAVGGAVAGNQIEKSVKSTKSYDITVRFEDGSSRVINEENGAAWRPGDRVKVINGGIRSNG
jgi:outer membrane lipoprotein SlyB